MFERLSRYLKRTLIIIFCFILYYLLIFVATDTKNVIESKKELENYISLGYIIYLDNEVITDKDYDNIYSLVTEYDYEVNENEKVIYLYNFK